MGWLNNSLDIKEEKAVNLKKLQNEAENKKKIKEKKNKLSVSGGQI